MRIAILGAGFSTIPPLKQGGTEWIIYYQAKWLSKKGHEVYLVAASGTKENFVDTKVNVIEVDTLLDNEDSFDAGLVERSRNLRLEAISLAKTSQKLIDLKNSYDLILNNMRGEAIFLPIVKILNKEFINVMHLNLFSKLADLFREYGTKVITISNSQRKGFPNLNYLATIYNCVDIEKFSFNPNPEDYLLMVGTIGRHKNQGEAIAVAKELGMRLVLAGKIRDRDYFEELKKDIDGEQIKWVGEIGFEEKVKLYQNAKAFIFPINWEEPFGLVMIEAMSCGTPVVAFNRGAVSEVVRDNLTGYVVNNHSQMVEAVKAIDSIDRAACRKHVENNFSVSKMIDGYEDICQRILSQ